MKYPITPDYIRNAPEQIALFYENLCDSILQDICERLKWSDGLQATAIEHIRELQRRGYRYEDIREFIKKTMQLSDAEYNRIIEKAINDNQRYYSSVLTESMLMTENFDIHDMEQEVSAIVEQCKNQFTNITKSLGFCLKRGGKVNFLPVAQAYQSILSEADLQVMSGTKSYNQVMREAVKKLADSGLRAVTWSDDGKVYHVDHADVAVRRAVMTGIVQISAKYSDRMMQQVPTDYMEITAHQGARDVDVIGKSWCNHKNWQGKVYSIRENDKYPSVYKVCGWGLVDGLEGANCRHLHYPFWEGISERTYSDEELANIDPPNFEFDGRMYSAYQATQRQREIERGLRKCKREMLAFEASGDEASYCESAIKYRRLKTMYKDFTEAAGMRNQIERGNIAEFGTSDAAKANSVAPQSIASGSIFVNSKDDFYQNAKQITPIDGFEDIVVHGGKYGLAFRDSNGKETTVSVLDFVEIIRESNLYHGGAIRLVSCETGADGAIVAQGMADILNVDILAPSDIIWVDERGVIKIGPSYFRNTGEWRLFKPGMKGVFLSWKKSD